jgi:hypothetical protein
MTVSIEKLKSIGLNPEDAKKFRPRLAECKQSKNGIPECAPKLLHEIDNTIGTRGVVTIECGDEDVAVAIAKKDYLYDNTLMFRADTGKFSVNNIAAFEDTWENKNRMECDFTETWSQSASAYLSLMRRSQ